MIETVVKCDVCGFVGRSRRARAHVLRTELRALHWHTGTNGGKDLCPECAFLADLQRLDVAHALKRAVRRLHQKRKP